MTPLDWREDTGHWEDEVLGAWDHEIPSWVGTNPPFVAHVRQEADGSFTWIANLLAKDDWGTGPRPTRIDQGVTTTLEWAQQHATNAILWYRRGN